MSLRLSSQPFLCFSEVYIMSLIYLDGVETSSIFPCSSLLMEDVMLNALDNATIEKMKSQLQIGDTSIFDLGPVFQLYIYSRDNYLSNIFILRINLRIK